MFEELEPAPADSIFGLNEQYLRDGHPHKINLTVGVYQDEQGQTPILKCVRDAEQRLVRTESTKDYLSMNGLAEYNRAVADLVLGNDRSGIESDSTATLQTLGGTGALRLTADFLASSLNLRHIWLSDPTWPNHLGIFRAAGLTPQTYRYLDPRGTALDFSGMMEDLQQIPAGSPVLLHAVCHNPTGFDLSPPQWEELAELIAKHRLITVLDFAYQGLGESIEGDAGPIRLFCERRLPMFVCSSFSKNMGLYGERVGACSIVLPAERTAAAVLSHLKLHARCSYSNPVRHGASLAALVLTQPKLRAAWIAELNAMRVRLQQLRELWLRTLRQMAPSLEFDFIQTQRGMFSYSGLDARQVQQLREKYSIYALQNGRVNIAGIRPDNVERLCTAIADVCGAAVHSRSSA
jgi:aspartate aminotransferase